MLAGGASGKNTTNPVDDGDMWECPDFFALSGKHVLLMSTMGKVRWKVGVYKDLKFTPEKEGVVDHGAYYAAKSMLDRNGNRILWGWIPETRPESEFSAAGWAGAMALPRVLSLNSEGELAMEVATVVEQLRENHAGFSASASKEIKEHTITGVRISDLSAEVRADVRPQRNRIAELRLLAGNSEMFASIAVADGPKGRKLNVNGIAAPVSGSAESAIRIHLFLDGSVLEVFANGNAVITARVYRAPSGPVRLQVDGEPEVIALDVWKMRPISKNRLTSPLCG